MDKSYVLSTSVLFVMLFGLVLIPLTAGAGGLGSEKKCVERKITLDEVPAAVKTAILEAAGTHKIRELEEITGPDGVVYEAEWIVDGKEVEIAVAPDGTILEGDDDDGDDDDDDEDEDEDEDGEG